MRAVFLLARFSLASLITASVDFSVFWLAFRACGSITMGMILARIVAVVFNYTVVRRYIFFSSTSHAFTLPRYLFLVLCSGMVSLSLTSTLVSFFAIHVLLAKGLAETAGFFGNFLIQKECIFLKPKHDEPGGHPLLTAFIPEGKADAR